MDIDRLLRAVAQHGASDLHLQVASPPTLRVHGGLTPAQAPEVTDDDLDQMIQQIAPDTVREAFARDRSADFSYLLEDVARFRVNVFYEKDHASAVFRLIPLTVPPLADLNLPPVIQEIGLAERGLVLMTGTTGSGKSTTLAAIIDALNESRRLRIITIEDPIEFVHTSKKSLVAQREIGRDSPGFLQALRRALRQDPDVILIGELRDLETIKTALVAADTGHMVYSTVHTANASQTVQRLISMFPPNERDLLITQLATNLEAVISQRLARVREGKGRVPVCEIMRNSPVVRKLLLDGRTGSLPQAIANREQGMQLFDQHLADLYNAKTISGTEALRLATNPEAVGLALRGISSADTGAGLVR